ncbi:hypothetical protein PR202_gb04886 [Eleusine coracana subsp. coracana]|uniref:Uncharacterized protein n=1 Tax=Eleusine coracana subsp. coracana TaxID=191504 RepID=A0AAV5E361_ELECO|nr:hypothetical protein PR202_gb04886 [Eleusine coracana subsp. coracana]
MACSLIPLHATVSSSPRLRSVGSYRLPSRPALRTRPLSPPEPRIPRHRPPPPPRVLPDTAAGAAAGLRDALADAFLASPPTWRSAAASNLAIFVAGSPVLLSGLSASGFVAAYLLGTLTWRAFGIPGFLLVVAYFVVVSRTGRYCITDASGRESFCYELDGLGTAVTKLKIKQKEAMGVAEKRGGRRGPGSVVGSSAAGCVCALLSIYNNSYLVTTFKIVPRGTEGAISVEGSVAGILASGFLAAVGYLLRQVDMQQGAICIIASQIANYGESYIGATLQDKEGFEWVSFVLLPDQILNLHLQDSEPFQLICSMMLYTSC